jgi:hypothetical protein
MKFLQNSFVARAVTASVIAVGTLAGINHADAQLLEDNQKPIAEAITVVFWVVGLIIEAVRKRRERRGK